MITLYAFGPRFGFWRMFFARLRHALARSGGRPRQPPRYVGRTTARYYPEFREIAGCKAAA
jgi:hypothetical protein